MSRQYYSPKRSNTSYRSRPTQQPKRGPKKENIHHSRFIRKARPVSEQRYQPRNQFDDFKIHNELKARIRARGFTEPSPIQDQIIPHGLEGRDVIGVANTGTGKTMAFAIPLLSKLMLDTRSRALVMAPTRELAEQVLGECRTLFSGKGPYWSLLIGGMPMGRQFRELSRKPRLVIGTPGRIKDHLERSSLRLDDFNLVVLDEVDRMMDMGFINDMRLILKNVPAQNRQSFFFSATMTPKVKDLLGEFSRDPVIISVVTAPTTENVDQNIVRYSHPDDKLGKLQACLEGDEKKMLIFDDTRRKVERLHKLLEQAGYKVESIHGGKRQSQRRRALDKFATNQVNVLVATDVAARGIDIDGITHVVNYSLPQTYLDYTHRVGRAGRAGKLGSALTFVPDHGLPG